MANRLLVANVSKKLINLEKTANFPTRPTLRPSALYVEDVLNLENLPPPGKGSPREFYLKEIHKRVHLAWNRMDPSLKAAYEKQSEKTEKIYEKRVEQWYTENGESNVGKEIKLLREQLYILENKSN